MQVYALDFTLAICVVITGCGAAQPEITRTVAINTGNPDSGTYSVTSTGLLTLTRSSGQIRMGCVSADGNILVAATVMPDGAENPRILVGFRQ
jgi:TRAP-type uncharacterized transport system substrate-binding protein